MRVVLLCKCCCCISHSLFLPLKVQKCTVNAVINEIRLLASLQHKLKPHLKIIFAVHSFALSIAVYTDIWSYVCCVRIKHTLSLRTRCSMAILFQYAAGFKLRTLESYICAISLCYQNQNGLFFKVNLHFAILAVCSFFPGYELLLFLTDCGLQPFLPILGFAFLLQCVGLCPSFHSY